MRENYGHGQPAPGWPSWVQGDERAEGAVRMRFGQRARERPPAPIAAGERHRQGRSHAGSPLKYRGRQ